MAQDVIGIRRSAAIAIGDRIALEEDSSSVFERWDVIARVGRSHRRMQKHKTAAKEAAILVWLIVNRILHAPNPTAFLMRNK
jgi:hypothetical protein